MTLHTTFKGWVGWGIGDGMDKADITVVWKNSTGGNTISSRQGLGVSMPRVVEGPLNNVVELPLLIPFDATLAADDPARINIAVSFTKPMASEISSVAQGQESSFIFAMSDHAPIVTDATDSAFTIHMLRGIFAADFTGVAPPPAATAVDPATGATVAPVAPEIKDVSSTELSAAPILSNMNKTAVNWIHSALMFVAWGISPYIG